MFAEVAEIPNPIDLEPTDLGQIMVDKMFQQAVAPLDKLTNQKGKVGQGTEGASGAVDRITFEILKMLESVQRWWSGCSTRWFPPPTKKKIRDRFDRIYTNWGLLRRVEQKGFQRNNNDVPLLTSIVGFGSGVNLFTEEPTDDLAEIKSIVDNIEVDSSGKKKVFSAIASAADKYKSLRRNRSSRGPQRNLLFVVVTDERGDDPNMLEASVAECRKWGIPVYVIGVPAPFGREHSLVKYVDPDPEFDQTPQWAKLTKVGKPFYQNASKLDSRATLNRNL